MHTPKATMGNAALKLVQLAARLVVGNVDRDCEGLRMLPVMRVRTESPHGVVTPEAAPNASRG